MVVEFLDQGHVFFLGVEHHGHQQVLAGQAAGVQRLLQLFVDDALVGGVHVHQHHATAVLRQDVDAVQLRQGHAQRMLFVGGQGGSGPGLADRRDLGRRVVGQGAVQRLPVGGGYAGGFGVQAERHLGVSALRGRRRAQAIGSGLAGVAGAGSVRRGVAVLGTRMGGGCGGVRDCTRAVAHA
ncbi:hypothetical protein D3C73_1234540 [compost metagenome]